MESQGFNIRSSWHYRPYNLLSPYVILPGAVKDFCTVKGTGYVLLAGCTTTSPATITRIELETADGDLYLEEFSCLTLLGANLILPMPSGWWVSQVAPLVPAYSVMFTPASPWPFSKRLQASLINPTPLPITCVTSVLTILLPENQK